MARPSRNQTSYAGGLNYDHLSRYTVLSSGNRKRIVDLTPLECERLVLAAMPNDYKRADFLDNLGPWDKQAIYYVFDHLLNEKLITIWMEGEQS